MFDKIGKSQTLSQEIVASIEQAIRDKKFHAGDQLPTEKELGEMFGVSRTAIREALQMLSAQGLITVQKGKGSFINDYSTAQVTKPMSLFLELNFDTDFIFHVIRIRKMIEPEVARDAAKNRTSEDISIIKSIIAKMDSPDYNTVQQMAELDKEFHLAIARASKNPIIPIIVQPIFELMPKIKPIILSQVDVAKSDAGIYHHKIYDMIKKQDSTGAFEMMTKHLQIAEEHVNILKKML
ncbi:MAG: FadR family transcriptional regulator [Candidatus Marinimicrobia bacterium]|nr:FadR family transcriptional regulator [Candidatus Neomarinimicrobiota bacterium]